MMKFVWITAALMAFSSASAAVFDSCADAAKHGYFDIPEWSELYSAVLDKDSDGVACERKGEAKTKAAGHSPRDRETAFRQIVADFFKKLDIPSIACPSGVSRSADDVWKLCYSPNLTPNAFKQQVIGIKTLPFNKRNALITLRDWDIYETEKYLTMQFTQDYILDISYIDPNKNLTQSVIVITLGRVDTP